MYTYSVCALCCIILLGGFGYIMLYDTVSHIILLNNQHQSPFGGPSINLWDEKSLFFGNSSLQQILMPI